MAESLAIEVAKSIAELVKARGCEEIQLAWNFQDHFAKLSDSKLLYAKAAFQKSVGSAKHSDENDEQVNSWLQQVKNAVYDAEDVMDDYEYEKLRRKIEVRSSKRKVYNFLNCKTNPVVFRFKMTHKVLDVLSKFDELNKKAKTIGLLKQAGSTSNSNIGVAAANDQESKLKQIRELADAPNANEFVLGRKDAEKELIRMICEASRMEGDLLSTIAIQGIGGLGKTTLAKHVFHHKDVDKQFGNNKVQICVSDNFNVPKLLNAMLESLTSFNHGLSETAETITKKLNDELKGEKFLLLLDDVWETDSELWDSFRNKLQRIGDPSKSVILITTRKSEVAEKAHACVHKLEGLSEDDGWSLLQQKAFESTEEVSRFKDVGKKIVRKCAGVPLAIKAMGPILKKKKNPHEWESVLTTELSDLPQDEENYILPSLRLSYNHLPSVAVKQCFAYCAIFPKDTELDKHVLITLWMAQGFLQRTNNMPSTMEDIGEDYFAHLLHHSFLEEERVVDKIIGTKSYKMHDLVHDLAIDVSTSGKDLFVWKDGSQLLKDVSDARHFVLNFEEDETIPKFPTEMAVPKLRTIHFLGDVSMSWGSIICAEYIRVLIVANIGLSDIPNDIGQLTHLRYLDLSHNHITTLPESLCKLYQLQTLRLSPGNYKLKELPRKLYKLRNLRHIDHITNYDYEVLLVSRGLGLLTNLQTLPHLKLCDEDERWTIDELESLNEIKGVLEISRLEHVKNKEEARKASLRSKGGIIRLKLKWSSRDEDSNSEMMNIDEDVLGGLELPPNIKDLCVKGFRGLRFPSSWLKLMVLSNVTLGDCKRCKQLPTLGQLPSLKYLMLEEFSEVESIGNEFYVENTSIGNIVEREGQGGGGGVFGALRVLYIVEFESLTSWMPFATTSSSAFPILKDLEIFNCPKLERVPALHFQSLKTLSLNNVGGSQPLDIIKYSQGSLEELYVRYIYGPEKEEWSVPQELFNCSNLEKLTIVYCENLKSIGIPNPNPNPNPNGEMMMMMMPSLKELRIVNCPTLTCIPTALVNCTSLELLHIMDCENLKSIGIPDGELMMTSLKKFEIGYCPTLTCIPTALLNCTSLELLDIKGCENLKSIGIPNGEMLMMSSLKKLEIENCPALSLSCIPSSRTSVGKCTSLWKLCLCGGCLSIGIGMEKSDVPDLSQLKRLEELTLFNAGEMMMTSAARSIPQLDSLRRLEIGGFKDEEEITKFVSQIKSTPHSLSLSLSLREVILSRWPKVKKMPEQLQHLLPSSTLQELIIHTFDELEQLPDWIGNLSSLKTLVLSGCNKLKYLPSKQAMMHLSQLYIYGCPELKERCEKHSNNENDNDNGPPHSESQWPNIERIPFIEIDGEIIQDLV